MMNSNLLQDQFLNHNFDDILKDIYGNDEEMIIYQTERYSNAIEIKSEGYPLLQFDFNNLNIIESEKVTTTALCKCQH